MTKAELRKKYAHMIGRSVRLGDEPDRMITKILHEEPNGHICVSTVDLYAFSIEGEDWSRQLHLPNSVQSHGPCGKSVPPRRQKAGAAPERPTKTKKNGVGDAKQKRT